MMSPPSDMCSPPEDFPFKDFFFAILDDEFDPLSFYKENYCSIK